MQTFGWDTVYALGIEKVNAVLASRRDQLILAFDSQAGEGLPVSAQGEFGDWAVVTGGSGSILHLRLTISSGTYRLASENPVRELPLSGVGLTVAVQLKLLPSTSDPKLQELRFDIATAGEMGDKPAPGVITPVALHDPSGKFTEVDKALLSAMLTSFIAANANRISFVFATINLVPPGENSWLTPVRSAYAYADRSGTSGMLAILSVTTDRNIADLPRGIDAALLTHSYDAAFAISRDLFLGNVIWPNLPQVFGNGTSMGSFALRDGALVNTTTVALDGIKVGAITYHPEVRQLSITTSADGLASAYAGETNLKAGISMTYFVNPRNQATYDARNKTLSFRPDPNPVSGHEADIPWYWWFAGLVVKPVVDAIVTLIASRIAEAITQDAGQRISFTRNPPTSIRWSGTGSLDVQEATVSGGFYMRGNLS
jgi:hypothetical protein